MADTVPRKHADHDAAGWRLSGILLGVSATLTSLCITVIAGEERGATWVEKAVWVATGIVILLAAHFLPALTKGKPLSVRGLALPVWVCALLATGYTHATFFLNAQDKAGAVRASVLVDGLKSPVVPHPENVRSRTEIARDVATTLRGLAAIDAHRCVADCSAVGARRKMLSARLDALKVEDAEAVRGEKASDARLSALERVQAEQMQARVDPFVGKVSRLLGLAADQVSLALAVTLGWLVDAIAVIAWTAVGRSCRATGAVEVGPQAATSFVRQPARVASDASVVMASSAAANEPMWAVRTVDVRSESTTDKAGEVEAPGFPGVRSVKLDESGAKADLDSLAAAIRSGRAKTTLSSIQAYLDCSDSAAMAFRRRLAEEHAELFRPTAQLG